MIAALYVQDGGCYFGLEGVDPWPQARDARKYPGPHPVVAHPPCQLWGALAAVNYARWGGEHNRPGNDGGTFRSALDAVMRWGGVLEHPAKTLAWAAHGLAKPRGGGWQRTPEGWVCEVWQSAYGHRANKATWLFYSGAVPMQLDWSRPIGTHQVGFADSRGKDANKPTLSKAEANATPVAFRNALISLAINSQPSPMPALTGHLVVQRANGGGSTAVEAPRTLSPAKEPDMIYITLKWDGVRGFAECRAADETYSEYGRTQANALSNICARLARVKALVGREWYAPSAGLRGVVGEKLTKGRRSRIAEMDTFELVGGLMHPGKPR